MDEYPPLGGVDEYPHLDIRTPTPTLLTEWMAEACENITFPQLMLREGIYIPENVHT